MLALKLEETNTFVVSAYLNTVLSYIADNRDFFKNCIPDISVIDKVIFNLNVHTFECSSRFDQVAFNIGDYELSKEISAKVLVTYDVCEDLLVCIDIDDDSTGWLSLDRILEMMALIGDIPTE